MITLRPACLRIPPALAALSLLCLIAPASGQAAQRYASPSSSVTSGSCPQSTPCRIDRAVAVASAGDEVIVAPGDYAVTYPILSTAAIAVHGEAGQPRPRLIGGAALTSPTLALRGGATVSHLYLEANGNQAGALSIEGGVAEDLVLYSSPTSSQGQAISVKNAPSGTLVRNVIARSASPSGQAFSFKDGAIPGTAKVVHVTAVAEGASTNAFSGNVVSGSVAIVNSIAVSSGGFDVMIKPGTQPLSLSRSSYRPAISSGANDGGGNQSAAPSFVDAPARDYHQAAASPTIGAATFDADAGLVDIDGDARSILAPDMGADEYPETLAAVTVANPGGAGTPAPSQPGTAPSAAATSEATGDSSLDVPVGETSLGAAVDAFAGVPASGKTIGVGRVKGDLLVRAPGAGKPVVLTGGSILPVGTQIDATAGEIVVTTVRDSSGGLQSARFWGGRFVVRQKPNGITRIELAGGDFSSCPRDASRARGATASSSRKRRGRRSVVRTLWARDNGGRYSTHGRDAVATVRGTSWVTRDRCDGTLVTVSSGKVAVRPARGGRSVLVRAGRSKLVPHRR